MWYTTPYTTAVCALLFVFHVSQCTGLVIKVVKNDSERQRRIAINEHEILRNAVLSQFGDPGVDGTVTDCDGSIVSHFEQLRRLDRVCIMDEAHSPVTATKLSQRPPKAVGPVSIVDKIQSLRRAVCGEWVDRIAATPFQNGTDLATYLSSLHAGLLLIIGAVG